MVFGKEIAQDVHEIVVQVTRTLEKHVLPGVIEWIPAYTSVTVFYRPDLVSYAQMCEQLTQMIETMEHSGSMVREKVRIPVMYGEEFGPDIQFVADHAEMAVEKLVELHCAPVYQVYMIGFVPGFPYLGGMDRRISAPRLESPRISVPAGSVGIAGEQTGIYPLNTPGGWRIIGRTPIRLYDPAQEIPSLLKAGDLVQFVPINREQYRDMEDQVRRGTFCIESIKKGERFATFD